MNVTTGCLREMPNLLREADHESRSRDAAAAVRAKLGFRYGKHLVNTV